MLGLFFLILFSVDALSYCNESVVFDNNNISQNYNITKQCTPEYNNFSFIFVGFVFVLLLLAASVLIIRTQHLWLKVILFVFNTMIFMSLARLMAWFVEITNPLQTGLIQFLNHWYNYGIWTFRISLVLGMIFLVLHALKMMDFRNKENNKPKWKDYGL